MRAVRATTVFDGERFLDGGATLFVDGALIAGVEPYGAELPADVPVTSYDGTLLPGLFDCHAHLVADSTPGGLERTESMSDDEIDVVVADSLARQLASGVTAVRDLGDRRYRAVAARDRAQAGLPRIVASGPPFTVPAGHCHYLGGAVAGREAIEEAMAEHVAQRVDVVKVMASGGMLTPGSDQLGVQFSAEDLRSIVEVAHEAGLQVLAHSHSLAGAWHAVHAGVDGLEHFTCLSENGPFTPDDLLDAVAAAGITIDPTLGLDPERMLSPDQLPPRLRELMDRFGLEPDTLRDTRTAQMARARRRGIRVVSGVDSGVGPAKPHGILWRSVLDLLRADYTVAEALSTATSTAADACGLGSVTGRLRPGLDADLLAVDGDLRTDPDALGRPVAVLVRGEAPFAG
jgi:imidazolonepropionase-like amidohydrolase